MLSHDHQCIFVHVPKTAGMSIEQAFLDDLGLASSDRHRLLMHPNPDDSQGPPRLAHLTAQEYVERGHVSQETFDAYFTFSVVRNPWARVVSMYRYLGQARATDLADFVFNTLTRKLWKRKYWFVRPQLEFLIDSRGEVMVDEILKFENLQKEFDCICQRLGWTPRPLPHVNASKNKDPGKFSTWREHYRDDTKRWVAELYATDIEAFDYSFD